MPKTNLVAIQYGANDTVLNVIKVFNVDDRTLRELKNKKCFNDQKEKEKQEKLLSLIDNLVKKVEQLEKEVKELKGE